MTDLPTDPWAEVAAARLPLTSLVCLAVVRHHPGILITLQDSMVWVTWPPQDREVLACLLGAPQVVFFVERQGVWYQFGHRVPSNQSPPMVGRRALAGMLTPGRWIPQNPEPIRQVKVTVKLVRGGTYTPTTAMRCSLDQLARWANVATTMELTEVAGVQNGDHGILRGQILPSLANATRYWGAEVLRPVGFRTEPALPDAGLRTLAGAESTEVVIFDHSGVTVIPATLFQPLTRARIRQAVHCLVSEAAR